MQQLTSLDAQFLAMEDARTHGHVCAVLMLAARAEEERPLTAAAVRDVVAARIHALPLLRRRIAAVPFGLAHPFWDDDPAPDLAYHVRDSPLTGAGDLEAHIAWLHTQQLDRRRPLWEIHLIHRLEGSRQALVIKVHHAATDGLLGLAQLAALLAPATEVGPTMPERRTPAQLLLASAARLAEQPLHAARALPRVLAHLDAMPMTRALPGAGAVASATRRTAIARHPAASGAPAGPAPRTAFNGRISADRRVAFISLPLEVARDIGARADATVNDVVVTLVAAALRAWLQRRDVLPAEPLVAMVPVSLRTGRDTAADGNQVSPMLTPIPTDEPNPALRLEATRRMLRAAKAHHRGLPETLLADANLFIPPMMFGAVSRAVARLAADERLAPPCNVVISNLAGPPSAMSWDGRRIDALFPMSAVVDGIGLNVTVVSYDGSLRFGIVADAQQLPDPAEIADDLAVALDELAALVPA